MALAVTVALASNPERDFATGLRHPEDFEIPWADREHVDLTVEEDETLGSVLQRAAREFGVEAPHWAEREFAAEDLSFVDFYRPEAQQVFLRREFALVDEDGRAYWTRDWREVPYRELLRASVAGTLPGDPRRVYLLVQPGVGNGALSDFVTLVELWGLYWDVFQFVWSEVGDEALKGFGLWQLWRWLRELRAAEAPGIVQSYLEEWRRRGMRPDNLRDLIGTGPWTTEQVARILGCSESEAETLLIGYGSARGQDGLWRKADDPTRKFIQDSMELLIGMPAADREALRDFLDKRFREFQETGQPPEMDWAKIRDLPTDSELYQRQAERLEREAAELCDNYPAGE